MGTMSDTPAAPRGLAGILMATANRLDEGEAAPALQKTQTFLLLALFLETCWPHVATLL